MDTFRGSHCAIFILAGSRITRTVSTAFYHAQQSQHDAKDCGQSQWKTNMMDSLSRNWGASLYPVFKLYSQQTYLVVHTSCMSIVSGDTNSTPRSQVQVIFSQLYTRQFISFTGRGLSENEKKQIQMVYRIYSAIRKDIPLSRMATNNYISHIKFCL